MNIIDLSQDLVSLYFLCPKDWSDEIEAAGHHQAYWYQKMKDRGLRVKLALADPAEVGGILPIEHSMALGYYLYFILGIWVCGHRQGRGNYQNRGMGRPRLPAAEADAAALGARGMAAWGISLPFWMKASWFKKQGHQRTDKQGMSVLLWKPLVADTVAPQWIKQKHQPEKIPGQVPVTAFINGWCPAQKLAHERARVAAQESDKRVAFREINTFSREVVLEWGISAALFIDDRPMRTGHPRPVERMRQRIAKKLLRPS